MPKKRGRIIRSSNNFGTLIDQIIEESRRVTPSTQFNSSEATELVFIALTGMKKKKNEEKRNRRR